MSNNKMWNCYKFYNGDVLKYIGITTNLKRRESEHKLRWPYGKIVKIGKKMTFEEAKAWEIKEKNLLEN